MIRPRPANLGGNQQGYTHNYPPQQQQQQYAQGQPSQQYAHGQAGQMQQHQQQQQQQQQQQAQGAQSVNGTADGASGSGGAQGQEMNLASVLHYLQSEWRRWERDRNEWEIERAEMRARIALLEGQRRSAENLKVDLLRRVKMLEFALRQERTKTVGSGGKNNMLVPARLAALQDEDRPGKDDKESSGSEGSQEDAAERPAKTNGIHPAAIGKASTMAARHLPEASAWKNVGSAPRDPKSRARSREYLKQCLQEISYLTSPGALNPLPPRPPVDSTFLQSENEQQAAAAVQVPDRPRKSMPDQPIPSTHPPRDSLDPFSSAVNPNLPNGIKELSTESQAQNLKTQPPQKSASSEPESHSMSVELTARPPSSPAPRTMSLPDPEASDADEQSKQILTAIYRPDSKAAWREELRAANEKADKARDDQTRPPAGQTDEDQLASLSLNVDDEEGKSEEVVEKVWTSRRSLKSHLDIVRAIAFGHGPQVVLATGSDDNTVKIWSMEPASIMSQKSSATEPEPVITLRGHTAGITAVTISSSLSTVFSSSLDSTIRLWKLPQSSHDPYAAYDPSFAIQTLEGHTDAVWDICLLPPRDSNGKRSQGGRLVSASADGTIKIWEHAASSWALEKSLDIGKGEDSGVVPTALSVNQSDFGKVIVGLSDGRVKLYDVDSLQEVQVFGEKVPDGSAQVNAILSHPTVSVLVVAHEDGHLRCYDANSTSTAPTHDILAHPAPITSLSLSSLSPTHILTASTDCSVRLWDLVKKTCIQDLSGHRKRADEGVCAVASHPELPVIGTAGADGVVRLWGTG